MRRILPIVPLFALFGCPYTYTSDDAGNGAWVEQVVPAVLGRKPINALESQVLVDIADQDGRAAVVRLLTSLPEFDYYWSSVLADGMQLQRTGVIADAAYCWNNYSLYASPGAASPVLADGVATQVSATTAIPTITGSFTQADVLRSAIAADDLFAPWRARAMEMTNTGYVWWGPAKDVYLSAYTNRTPLCLQCHTSNGSSSEISSIPVDIDGSTFPGGYWTAENVHYAFGETLTTRSSAFGTMNLTCGAYWNNAEVDPYTGAGNEIAGIGLTQQTCAAWNDVGNACESFDTLDLDAALINGKLSLSSGDLSSGLTSVQAVDTGFSHSAVAGDKGLAMALALQVTEVVINELEGHGLTELHGHPRVDDQRSYLQGNAWLLVASNWSLRTVVSSAVLRGTFNMRPPSQAVAPYPFPMFFNSWAKDDALDDDFDSVNGQGDIVHRYSVPALFRSVHHALGWTAPQIFPSTSYPSASLQRSIGRYESYEETGFPDVTFQSLLTWEENVGTCRNPSTGDDWIDEVMYEINDDYLDLVYDYSLEDVLIALKDRLIQEPSIEDGWIVVDHDDEIAAKALQDTGMDWDDPTTVQEWAEREADQDDLREAQRGKARLAAAALEARMARFEAAGSEGSRPRDWREEFDDYAEGTRDQEWMTTWRRMRDSATHEEAASALDRYALQLHWWVGPVYQTEADKLEDYFGVSMGYPAALVPDLEDKLRGFCGTLLTTPQFMLGGVRRTQTVADPIPELLVCLPSQADWCDEHDLCTLYNTFLTANGDAVLTCPP